MTESKAPELTEVDLAEMNVCPCKADVPVLVAEIRRLRPALEAAQAKLKDLEMELGARMYQGATAYK